LPDNLSFYGDKQMILLNDLSVMESVDSTFSIIGGNAPRIVAGVDGFVSARVSGQVSASVSPHGSSGNASYGTAAGGSGAAAGAIGSNSLVLIRVGVNLFM
jgi:hypothetical protein